MSDEQALLQYAIGMVGVGDFISSEEDSGAIFCLLPHHIYLVFNGLIGPRPQLKRVGGLRCTLITRTSETLPARQSTPSTTDVSVDHQFVEVRIPCIDRIKFEAPFGGCP